MQIRLLAKNYALMVLIAAVGMACAVPLAVAEGTSPLLYEAKFGVLAHDVPNLWSGFNLERGVDINADLQFTPAVPFLGGAIRPAIGGSVNTNGYTSKGYIDARWHYETSHGIYFGLGIGAAVHDGHLGADAADRKALGSRVLFHFPFEIGYRFDEHHSISLYFEHMSNGYTQRYNEALDDLGIRYGYRF